MILDTENLPQGYSLAAKIQNLGFENEELFIVLSDSLIYLINKSPILNFQKEDEPGKKIYQAEYPLESVPWFIDAVENRLWRSESEGGEKSGVFHVVDTLNGEKLKVSRDMNCGAKYQKGISWKNLSRKPDNRSFGHQEIQLTDEVLLEGGLLRTLKSLVQSK